MPMRNRPNTEPSKREDWSEATVQEMADRLDAIGPPWGNSKLLASYVIEGFWIAYEAVDRLQEVRSEHVASAPSEGRAAPTEQSGGESNAS